MFESKELLRRVKTLESCLDLTQESTRERFQNVEKRHRLETPSQVTAQLSERIDRLEKLETDRIEALEKVEREKTGKIALDKFIDSVQAYKIHRRACLKCDGKMIVEKRSEVSKEASTRVTYSYYDLSGTNIPNGDDHREVLILNCVACGERSVMWAKDVEV